MQPHSRPIAKAFIKPASILARWCSIVRIWHSIKYRLTEPVPACAIAALIAFGTFLASPLLASAAEQARQEHHVGKVVFVELMTPDIAAAKRFYGGLFGWTFRSFKAGAADYALASLNGRPVAGLIGKDLPAGKQKQPAWLTFISVRDVDATKKIAERNGARLLSGPQNIRDRGREAVFADPQGAVFAVLASSSGDPPDSLAEPGEWIWSTLITRDPEHNAAFYQTLFDYEVYDLSPEAATGERRLILASENFARASANALPVGRPGNHSYWLNFIRVDDTAKAAARVVALGGSILIEPLPDRHGGKLAVAVDPSGAPFGLLEWPDTENKEVRQ